MAKSPNASDPLTPLLVLLKRNRSNLSFNRFDHVIAIYLHRYGDTIHRIALGVLFIWFGLLKPLGLKTATSLLAETVYLGSPEVMVHVLGWWEVAIGVCLIVRRLVRVAALLLLIRLPGTVLALLVHPQVCWTHFPFAPTPEGQYLLKDIIMFLATLALAGAIVRRETGVQQQSA